VGNESTSADSIRPPQQELTDRAVTVVQRVLDKLTGLDFQDSPNNSAPGKPLAISEQIDRLINEATSNDNLSTCYMGWCPLW
jgi:FKBP12-rapamycin complex-associated protein